MISKDEILQGRDKHYEMTPELWFNLGRLHHAINLLRAKWGKPMHVNSGWRPPEINRAVGGSRHSPHLTCQAVDINDPHGELSAWCLNHLDYLESCGLWLEDPKRTPGWVHLDLIVRKNRVFKP